MSDKDDAYWRARVAAWERREFGPLATELLEWIRRNAPRARRLPLEADLLKLAIMIDHLRGVYESARNLALPERANLQKALLDVLKWIEPVIGSAREEEQSKLANIKEAILALRPPPSDLPSIHIEGAPPIDVERVILPRTPESEHGTQWQQWHDYAVLLVKKFASITSVSLDNNDGPAAKFMEWIIPTISGEHPPGSTVMQFVRRALIDPPPKGEHH